jgi:hypothetical protein
MNQFTVNSLISRDTSTITGSLTVLGTIDTIIGTASLAQTSSQTQQTATASFSTVTLVQTSSYAQTSVSSSYALTASYIEDKGIGINSIGWLSPNVFMGNHAALVGVNFPAGNIAAGVMFSPIQIKKTCTCATMSISMATGTTGQPARCNLAIYTNSSNNLPEFRIFNGQTSANTLTSFQNYIVTQSAVTLNQNETYWVGLSLSGSNTRVLLYTSANNTYIYNELLGSTLYSTNPQNNNPYPQIHIRSGSTNLAAGSFTFPETSSQNIENYHTGIAIAQARNVIRMPFLKVEYT